MWCFENLPDFCLLHWTGPTQSSLLAHIQWHVVCRLCWILYTDIWQPCCIVIMSCLVLCVISVHPGAELLSVESQVIVVRRQRVGELSSVGYQDKSNAWWGRGRTTQLKRGVRRSIRTRFLAFYPVVIASSTDYRETERHYQSYSLCVVFVLFCYIFVSPIVLSYLTCPVPHFYPSRSVTGHGRSRGRSRIGQALGTRNLGTFITRTGTPFITSGAW